jgi:uncharacterized protein YyaL (SSP411 family)
VLLRLSLLLDRDEYRQRAESVLDSSSGGMERLPGAFGRLLAALDFYLSKPREVAIVGDLASPDTQALVDAVYAPYLPNKVVAGRAPEDEEAARLVPLLSDRPMRDGRPTAYVCEGYACKNPTTDPEELARQLVS